MVQTSLKTNEARFEQDDVAPILKGRLRSFNAVEWGLGRVNEANQFARVDRDPFIRYARWGLSPQEAANTLWVEELLPLEAKPPLLIAQRALNGTFIVRIPFPHPTSVDIYDLYAYFNRPPTEQGLIFYTKIAPKAIEIAQGFSFETTSSGERDVPLIKFVGQTPEAVWFTPPVQEFNDILV